MHIACSIYIETCDDAYTHTQSRTHKCNIIYSPPTDQLNSRAPDPIIASASKTQTHALTFPPHTRTRPPCRFGETLCL